MLIFEYVNGFFGIGVYVGGGWRVGLNDWIKCGIGVWDAFGIGEWYNILLLCVFWIIFGCWGEVW